jgi:hypothetical protein
MSGGLKLVPGSIFWSIFTGLLVALGVLSQFRERTQPAREGQP